MFEPIISGISFGLVLAILLGPVFFALLQTSLHEGFKAGVYLSLGVLASDATVISICYLFARQMELLSSHKVATGWVGGLVMIGFGVVNFFRKIKVKEVDDDKKTVHAHFITRGFLLNLFNPAVLLFWLSVVGIVTLKENYSRMHEAFFFGSLLTTVFSIDLLKAFVANKIKSLLKANVILWINRIIGIVLMGFGLWMILKVI